MPGLPVCHLLGGRYGDDFVLYRAISQRSPQDMAENVAAYRAEGYRRFQLKVGGDPNVDIERIRAVRAALEPGDKLVADANTGWLMHEALRVVNAVHDVDVYIEQPCATYQQCLAIRERTSLPMVLDEVIDSVDMILRAAGDRAMDVVNIKISKFGGLTRASQARDFCVSLGIAMTLEDSWGGDIVDGRHRALGTQHAARVLVHGDRFQQLRYPVHRGPCSPTNQRPHGGFHPARAGYRAQDERAGRSGVGVLNDRNPAGE